MTGFAFRVVLGAFAVGALASGAIAQPAPVVAVPEDEATALLSSVLKPTAPPALSMGTIAAGHDVMAVPMTYAYTGRLQTPVTDGTMWGISIPTRKPFPAGTPVFAISTKRGTGIAPRPDLMWCAAIIPPAGAEKLASRWSVTCFDKVFGRVRFLDVGWDRFPLGHVAAQLGTISTVPELDQTPIELAPNLTALVRFSEWDGTTAKLQIWIRQPAYALFSGDSPYERHQFDVAREVGPDGAAHLRVFGDEIAIRRAPDGSSAIVSLVAPVQP